jgi:lactoylglutathione lyase
MAKVIHSMIRVLNEERSLAFYQTAFGLKPVDRLDFDTFTLIYLANDKSSFELELTVNKGRTAAYELGEGYGHLAISVADLAAEHARMLDAGLMPRDIVSFAPGGEGAPEIARFFFIADPDGYMIEVIERGGRFS